MLDPAKPVGDCSPQDLVAALMLKAAFNQFDPKQVLSDLYAHREWWKSFAMGPPLPEDTEYPLDRVLIALRDLHYRWKADTLYVLSCADDYVIPLLDLSKEWQCSSTEVIDRTRTGSLLGRHPAPPPVVVYWWD
ncbi:hypothetical protein H6G89_28200 [Oscillatoria sp. FACHB-1407]|uniref:hypothetical protein n=1 Tax=Oscillatoria sp. FACHB-1407 TaxID=2692847 RepID=UPI00168654B6|nr:hypothetical protein [Oscillatoria sp. FACHB-1407]MBD2464890.1 hypothetical protein [Oscillatoria sp. FACHB-1407]